MVPLSTFGVRIMGCDFWYRLASGELSTATCHMGRFAHFHSCGERHLPAISITATSRILFDYCFPVRQTCASGPRRVVVNLDV